MSDRLFDPARHAPLIDARWDESAARKAIDAIVRDTVQAADANSLWPVHPEDQDGGATAFYDLYSGASGVVWALDALRREGATDIEFRPDLNISTWIAPNRVALAGAETLDGLLSGDAGLLIAQWRRKPDLQISQALDRAIELNLDNPALELMWGCAGSLLVALEMDKQTREGRWLALFRQGAQKLIDAFEDDEALGVALWRQLLGPKRRQHRMLGLAHGFAGNARALIRGGEHLDRTAWLAMSAKLARTLRATVRWDGDMANWPSHAGEDEPGRKMLMQICHGAPGMIVGLAELAQPIDDLLIAAGEAVWRAAPLAKGSNLCHGTAGNGYAFLKLFARTGNEMWLVRARAFAMHAIAQNEAEVAHYGMRRFSLWTGDPGLALYLWACLTSGSAFPSLDVL